MAAIFVRHGFSHCEKTPGIITKQSMRAAMGLPNHVKAGL